jgi:hypothetical protein
VGNNKKMSNLQARRQAIQSLMPVRDRVKDFCTIWFYRILVVVLLVLIARWGIHIDLGWLGTDLNGH